MASGLVMSMAEILSGLVVHQLSRPGSPFVFGAGLHHLDMKSSQISYGSPEFQLTKAAVAEIGRWYEMPTWGYAGCTDAKTMDEQAAAEALLSVMMAKLTGANLIHDVGYVESGLTYSYEMIVLTDELVTLADQLMKGIEVSPDTMMLDEIHQVGPGGHYMATEETLKRFRGFWYPNLLDRQRREQWVAGGSVPLHQRLNERVREIIREHEPKPLASDKLQKIDGIVAQARH
jgi:trimethylamine--corrinoid protein Co-methyltransferase